MSLLIVCYCFDELFVVLLESCCDESKEKRLTVNGIGGLLLSSDTTPHVTGEKPPPVRHADIGVYSPTSSSVEQLVQQEKTKHAA